MSTQSVICLASTTERIIRLIELAQLSTFSKTKDPVQGPGSDSGKGPLAPPSSPVPASPPVPPLPPLLRPLLLLPAKAPVLLTGRGNFYCDFHDTVFLASYGRLDRKPPRGHPAALSTSAPSIIVTLVGTSADNCEKTDIPYRPRKLAKYQRLNRRDGASRRNQ